MSFRARALATLCVAALPCVAQAAAPPSAPTLAACLTRASAAREHHDPGRAALWYRRALLLDPGDADAVKGLEALGLEPAPRSFEEVVPFGARRLAFFALWPLGWGLLVLGRRRRWLRRLGGTVVVAGLALGGSLAWSASRPAAGVVLSPAVPRAGDSLAFSPAGDALKPGQQVELLGRSERAPDWTRIAVDGRTGWLPAADLAPLRGDGEPPRQIDAPARQVVTPAAPAAPARASS